MTAASLFDGHDASINVMRRVLQNSGAEVIHLGHDRSVDDVVSAAIEEDAQAVAISSYQGGHTEYFTYMRALLDERGAPHVKIFGGGGGVITPPEIAELEARGVDKIFSPEDGRRLGLQGDDRSDDGGGRLRSGRARGARSRARSSRAHRGTSRARSRWPRPGAPASSRCRARRARRPCSGSRAPAARASRA